MESKDRLHHMNFWSLRYFSSPYENVISNETQFSDLFQVLFSTLKVLSPKWQAYMVHIRFFFFFKLFIYLFIYGCVGSSFLCEGSLQLWQVGATLHRSARASHHRGLSRCGAQAPDAQAQYLWLTGPAAPRHVGSSQTRARTRVPCIGRRIPNHCATREAPVIPF